MSREVRESVRIYVSGPSRQASVAECVERERLYLRKLYGLPVLLLQGGFFNVAATRCRREDPIDAMSCAAISSKAVVRGRERHTPPGILRLPKGYVQGSVANILPPQPETLLWPEGAIDQNRGDIS